VAERPVIDRIRMPARDHFRKRRARASLSEFVVVTRCVT